MNLTPREKDKLLVVAANGAPAPQRSFTIKTWP
jgi:hypothetical protein